VAVREAMLERRAVAASALRAAAERRLQVRLLSQQQKQQPSVESARHRDKIQEQFGLQAVPFAEFRPHSESLSVEVFQQLGQFTKSCRLLDVGCGPGIVSLHLAQHVAGHVTGLDLTPAMIARAQEDAAKRGLSISTSFQLGDMSRLPFADGTFDGVVTRYTFHHLEQPRVALRELVRVVKTGGRVVVCDATPTREKQTWYNAFEKLRDPSHTTALTSEELLSLLDEQSPRVASLDKSKTVKFELRLDARELIDKAFPDPGRITRDGLMDLLRADLSTNTLDFAIDRDAQTDRLTMAFPLTAAVWTKLK
jgi:ubiquinone/menaquinone biosynthesis C-methylase UbiE